uniref:Ig-like domain-containing protein n=1 Tax=Neogobius melanostomus TaxID=47308 RepID=A0A8C6WGK3_9GOBI
CHGRPYQGHQAPDNRAPGSFSDQSVMEGQEVTMSVRVCGQPKPMLYWLRDRVTVKSGARHVVRERNDDTFEMTIKSAQKSDSGIYTCKIINEYGTKQCEAALQVKGKADTGPTGGSVETFNL